jgi:Clp amino terminal domain, pathogenicity island component
VAQRSEHADRVLDLARKEADHSGHRYLGPEHLVLGVLRDGGSDAARVLTGFGVDLPAAQAELRHLAEPGVVPSPRPSDGELLGTLGIDLETIRRTTEEAFGRTAVGWAIREATRARRRGLGGCHERRCATHRWSLARCWFTPASKQGPSVWT